MCLSHIEYPALLLIDVGAVDDDAFEFVQFESSYVCQCVYERWMDRELRTGLDQIGDPRGSSSTNTHAKAVSQLYGGKALGRYTVLAAETA